MKWSQLKIRIEEFFADSVRERVELRAARYRKSHDQMGRGWITIDGQEVASMCDYTTGIARWRVACELRDTADCNDWNNLTSFEAYLKADAKAKEIIHAQGLFSREEFCLALSDYLTMPIDHILSAPNPIIRAIGMLDRRLGKRRLMRIDTSNEHSLVHQLHKFRLDAEGILAATGV